MTFGDSILTRIRGIMRDFDRVFRACTTSSNPLGESGAEIGVRKLTDEERAEAIARAKAKP